MNEQATTHNLCVVSVDYRLAPQANLDEILEDIRDASAWIRGELPRRLPAGVEIWPLGLALGGSSAGAFHLFPSPSSTSRQF